MAKSSKWVHIMLHDALRVAVVEGRLDYVKVILSVPFDCQVKAFGDCHCIHEVFSLCDDVIEMQKEGDNV